MSRSLLAVAVIALAAVSCSDSAPVVDGSPSTTAAVPAPTATPPPPTTPQTGPPPPTATVPAPPSPTATTGPPVTGATVGPVPPSARLRLEPIAGGLGQPVFLTAPQGDDRLFVVDQRGRIVIVREGSTGTATFLDIRELVAFGGEQGLLGLAFHPDYARNGRFFVNYTDAAGDTRVVEYVVSGDPDRADPGSARTLLTIDQPARNHNGGMVAFGPDGLLYVGTGDGGGAGDGFGHGQQPGTRLAAILRIDVDGDEPFAIPADNPFVGGGGDPAVWAYGARNPWRFSFDGDDLYVADVGQNAFEEVHVLDVRSDAGVNLGWPIMEGLHCFRPASGCDRAGLDLPVLEYGHGGGACSITGGYVYRGEGSPLIRGHYFYGDFCSGFIGSFRLAEGVAVDQRSWQSDTFGALPGLSSFGVDGHGELYVMTVDGRLLQVVVTG